LAIEHDIRAGFVEDRPDLAHRRVRRVGTRAVNGDMPVSENAVARVGGKVLAQPFHLGGQTSGQRAIQRDDVPVSEIEAVIAPLIRSSGLTEILEVGTAAAGQEVVVAWRRASARLMTTPGWLVAAAEFAVGPLCVRVIAEREDGACDSVEQ